MYIFIAADGRLSLRDSDDMRAFSIVEEQSGSADKWLVEIAEPAGEQHFWLDAKAVVKLSGRMQDETGSRPTWNKADGREIIDIDYAVAADGLCQPGQFRDLAYGGQYIAGDIEPGRPRHGT
jgi:hypothetical protein